MHRMAGCCRATCARTGSILPRWRRWLPTCPSTTRCARGWPASIRGVSCRACAWSGRAKPPRPSAGRWRGTSPAWASRRATGFPAWGGCPVTSKATSAAGAIASTAAMPMSTCRRCSKRRCCRLPNCAPRGAGSASGRYWPEPGGAGEIDIQARLTRAEGTSVWRYLPRVVNHDTQEWVRTAIRRAAVPDARLRLKGRLDDFPFRDGKGQFLVSVKVADGLLEYAPGWPAIDGIHGEVRFEGPGMRIEAPTGRMFNVKLLDVVADVPDLDALPSEVMTITGQATGTTADFLRFIAESPVAGHIDHFTDGMRAEGNGALDLRLVMPLRKVADTTVKGDYRFTGNRLWLVDGVPPLDAASGRVSFTEKSLAIPEVRAQALGEPMRLVARTEADGSVHFEAAGAASVAAARAGWRQAEGWPVLDHLSGTTPWKADIRVGRGGTRVLVSSELDGISTSLLDRKSTRLN